MLLVENVQQQLQLLLQQRQTLTQSRYSGFTQLRQHDNRLADCVQLAADCGTDSSAPDWLLWLLGTDNSAKLTLTQLAGFTRPSDVWLLLHELKSRRCPGQKQIVATQLQQANDGDAALNWALATRLQLTLNPFTTPTAGTAEALWYLLCSAQTALLPALTSYARQLPPHSPLLPMCRLAACLLGDKTDESALVAALTAAGQLTEPALMLLMAAAADTVQSRIINQLSNAGNTAHQAIAAMGYSGQLKFVPLLLELAQAEDSREAATDSLALLLGIAEADSLLSATKTTADFQLAQGHARQLGGGHINSVQLDDVWLRGNQQQRQLAACYRSLAAAGTPLLNANALSCRL
ncbi:hypothetical protein [Rheinheimera sp. NSM]|uniref:hypothetical protein n=1 Tax=Rheinheimera sp. NSM TaxID=3457884 RepID=UPI004035C8C2